MNSRHRAPMRQTESPMKAANFMTSSLLSGHEGSPVGFCTHRILHSKLPGALSRLRTGRPTSGTLQGIILWVERPWGLAGAKQRHKV